MTDTPDTKLMRWVFAPSADQAAALAAFRKVHEASGYKAYNPFPGGMGTPGGAKSLVRAFIAPSEAGWVKMIGHMDVDLVPVLAKELNQTLVHIWLNLQEARIEAVGSQKLAGFLRKGKSERDLDKAIARLGDVSALKPVEGHIQGELADLIDQSGVNRKMANMMINQSTNKILKEMGGEGQAALDLLAQQSQSPLRGESGRRMKDVAACLSLPENWHEPEFKDLSAVYAIALMLEKDENAPLLPGDEDLLDKIAYPLDYEPAYFAR